MGLKSGAGEGAYKHNQLRCFFKIHYVAALQDSDWGGKAV